MGCKLYVYAGVLFVGKAECSVCVSVFVLRLELAGSPGKKHTRILIQHADCVRTAARWVKAVGGVGAREQVSGSRARAWTQFGRTLARGEGRSSPHHRGRVFACAHACAHVCMHVLARTHACNAHACMRASVRACCTQATLHSTPAPPYCCTPRHRWAHGSGAPSGARVVCVCV